MDRPCDSGLWGSMVQGHQGHSFRADIAGLRAVAVLPILLFHAGLSGLGGGFVGVDVFFVISGFLITGILIRDLRSGGFSILEFYRRRVARIVPALLLVLAVTMVAGVAFMLPSELRELGVSTAAAAAFVSNFHFLSTTDYFGGAAESKPLLHTWSLAVEEQYYIFFPILMALIWKFGARFIRPAILTISLASFALALLFAHFRPDVSFYMFPTRAWELGIGAMIAAGGAPDNLSANVKRILASAGLAMILFAIVFIRPDALFPAPMALLPTLGAGLLIAYGREGPTAALLSTRPLVWIGDISYSLYLWHWPIITFYRLQTGIDLNPVETACLVIVSVAAAAFTRVLVEEPSRKRLARLPRRPVVIAGAVALLLMAGVSIAISRMPTTIRPLPERVLRTAAVADYPKTNDYRLQFRKGVCFMGEADAQTFNRNCLATESGRSNWVVFGDSHAAQYWRAFADYWPERHVIQATASGCRPLIGSQGPKRCTAMVDYVLADLLRPEKVDGVVMAGRWRESEIPALVQTVRSLQGRGVQVVVLGPNVEYDGDMPLIMARAQLSNSVRGLALRRIAARRDLDDELGTRIKALGATYISQFAAECPSGKCLLLDDRGDPLHFDYGHLTLRGAKIMVERFSLPTGPGRLQTIVSAKPPQTHP